MRKNKDCAVIQLRDDPTQKSGYIDGLSDADCHAIQDMIDKHDMPCKPTPLTKDQVGAARRRHARYAAHTSGNAYVLYVQARSYDQKPMRVQAYGKNVYQAVRRYYRGLDNKCNHVWKCTSVVAVYTCADKQTAQAGDLLHGVAQDSAPW